MGIKQMYRVIRQLVQLHLHTVPRSYTLGSLLHVHTLSQAAPSQQWSARLLAVVVALNRKAGSHPHLMTCAMVEI
jgi:hypothetical protein